MRFKNDRQRKAVMARLRELGNKKLKFMVRIDGKATGKISGFTGRRIAEIIDKGRYLEAGVRDDRIVVTHAKGSMPKDFVAEAVSDKTVTNLLNPSMFKGRIISEKNYDFKLNVLPPLIMGKAELIRFLKKKDDNDDFVEALERPDVVGAFMQGEGIDRHDIYYRTKGDKFFRLGSTKKRYNTESFRYNDWEKMSDADWRKWNFIGEWN